MVACHRLKKTCFIYQYLHVLPYRPRQGAVTTKYIVVYTRGFGTQLQHFAFRGHFGCRAPDLCSDIVAVGTSLAESGWATRG